LSQLYQLRGRVGRFKHQAYAYLLLHRHTRLLEIARQRLTAMRQNNQLGAGFRIAMRDLELRGAGNLLGAEQSGHIVGVGFELYCQLLRQSVARLKGEKSAAAIRATYRQRLTDLAAWRRLLTGRIDLAKAMKGLRKAAAAAPQALATRVVSAIEEWGDAATVLLASGDATAQAYAAAARHLPATRIDTASHSFARVEDQRVLHDAALAALAHR
jgi:transcription-repair coupling factor (superfamily II helicase)